MRSSSEMTMPASSTSWCSTVSTARSSAVATMSSPPSAIRSRLASSSWKCVRVVAVSLIVEPLPDLARHVGLRPWVAGVGEDLCGLVELHHPAGAVLLLVVELDGEEGGLVGHARGLLHVVGHDHDRVVALELQHQVLDLAGRDRVERGARLVHQDHVGLNS